MKIQDQAGSGLLFDISFVLETDVDSQVRFGIHDSGGSKKYTIIIWNLEQKLPLLHN